MEIGLFVPVLALTEEVLSYSLQMNGYLMVKLKYNWSNCWSGYGVVVLRAFPLSLD